MAAVIGALRIELSAAIAKFQSDMGKAGGTLGAFTTKYERMASRIESVGKKLTISLTAPIVAFATVTSKVAGDFESSMNKVEAATGATADQLKELRDAAVAFGKDKTLTSTAAEASETMLSLAKNGLTTTQILGGATKATLKLAAATGGNFDQAANITTDTMQQFGKRAEDMSDVVDKITGALVVSKFSFDDYRLAIGQAGGVAGGLGIKFEDFNTALAATSALFTSGSDAGTSFKTFLTKLSPTTKQEAKVMKDLGLNFFDAGGQLKSLGDIAQILQDKLGGLNDKAKQQVLTKIFGTDAMRTAIALMNQGAAGIEDISNQINKIDADSQIKALTKGLNGMVTQAKKSFTNLAIAIGDSGFLDWLTKAVKGVTDLIDKVAGLPKPVLAFAAATAAVLLVLGPVTYGLGALIGTYSTLISVINIGRVSLTAVPLLLGAITKALAPQIVALRLYAATMGLSTAATEGFISAVGLLAVAVGVFAALAGAAALAYYWLNATTKPTNDVTKATQGLALATDAYVLASQKASLESGEAQKNDLAEAATKRQLAIDTLKAAKAKLAQAQATIIARSADLQTINSTVGISGVGGNYSGVQSALAEREKKQAQTNAKALQKEIADAQAKIAQADAVVASAAAPTPKPKETPKPKPIGLSTGTEADLLGSNSSVDKIAKATRKYGDDIKKLQQDVSKGLSELTQPATLVAVASLYEKIDDITSSAKDAGVPVKNFAGQIDALKKRIEELKVEGLAKEAEAFRLEVEKSGRAVETFGKGSLPPLEQKLLEVDNAFESLRDSIKAAIEANEVLAESNPDAARAMKALKDQLDALTIAHDSARNAAKEQYAQEQKIADLQMGIDNQSTREAIVAAQKNNGTFGPTTSSQDNMQSIEDDLTKQRLESAKRIAEYDQQITEAKRSGDNDQLTRLESELALEQQLYDIVSTTSAAQIDAATKIKEAFDNFASSLSDDLSTMITNWKGDIGGLNDIFKELARTLFIKPVTDQVSGSISSALQGLLKSSGSAGTGTSAGGGLLSTIGNGIKSIFSGFHAKGGVIRPGQWGVVGEEGPEPAFGGTTGLSIVPNSASDNVGGGSGTTVNQYITTPDPNAFRASQRQIARQAKKGLAK